MDSFSLRRSVTYSHELVDPEQSDEESIIAPQYSPISTVSIQDTCIPELPDQQYTDDCQEEEIVQNLDARSEVVSISIVLLLLLYTIYANFRICRGQVCPQIQHGVDINLLETT